MSESTAVKVENVSKTFRLPHDKNTSIKGAVLNFYKRKRTFEKQQVLNNVSFEIKQGEFFGIVGRNGSGKSTLLKMLAGIYSPSKGSITINGKLTPFIELGVGFSPELTGRENVFLNGALLGFSRQEMNDLYDDIVDFAELHRFMDQKLKNYSSGMQVRLAFSIAIRAKSDILLIDEVLAVGDAAFQTKCFDYFYNLKKQGVTVIFVSHDKTSLERFCDRGILINEGDLIDEGNMRKVLKSYSKVVLKELENAEAKDRDPAALQVAVASEFAEIHDVVLLNSKHKPGKRFVYGREISAQFEVKILKPITNPILGITVWQKNVDKAVYATNTLIESNKETGSFSPGDNIVFRVKLPTLLNDGEYYVEPAIANESAAVFYDQQPKAATFFINGSNNPYSVISNDTPISLVKS